MSTVDEIFEELTGMTAEDGKEDIRGCYFSSDKWVSAETIYEALEEAFEAGKVSGESEICAAGLRSIKNTSRCPRKGD